MEDNNILLMRVLKIHYKDRLEVLDEALKVIKEYSKKPLSNQSEYDNTSLTLQNMLNDLPLEILKYFLTMVPLPKNQENLERNKDETTNIRSILLKYLNEDTPPVVIIAKPDPEMSKVEDNENSPNYVPPRHYGFKNTVNATKKNKAKSKKKIAVRGPIECKKLVDICAEYVIQNEKSLNQDYQAMKDKVWKMVYSNKYTGATLAKLYEVIRDLNKKIKWMRQIDAEDISADIIKDEYGRSNIFVKERHLSETIRSDPLQVGHELHSAIINFVYK